MFDPHTNLPADVEPAGYQDWHDSRDLACLLDPDRAWNAAPQRAATQPRERGRARGSRLLAAKNPHACGITPK